MKELSRCCCFSLAVGSTIIGTFDLITSLVSLIVVSLRTNGLYIMTYDSYESTYIFFVGLVLIDVILGSIFITDIILLIGIAKRIPLLLTPWIIIATLGNIMVSVIFLIYASLVIGNGYLWGIIIIFMVLIFLVYRIYTMLIVFNLFRQFKGWRNTTGRVASEDTLNIQI